MDLIFSIIYGIGFGITAFFPFDEKTHFELLAAFTTFPAPPPLYWGTFYATSALATLILFRHEVASVFSSTLEVLLLWRRPHTIDGQLLGLLFLSCSPALAFHYFGAQALTESFSHLKPLTLTAFILMGFGFALPVSESFYGSIRHKSLISLNIGDALLIGMGQSLAFLPGGGALIGGWMVTTLRNYHREPAIRYLLLCQIFFLGFQAEQHLSTIQLNQVRWVLLRAREPGELSILSLSLAGLCCFVTSLLVINSLQNAIGSQKMTRFSIYRILLGAGILAVVYLL